MRMSSACQLATLTSHRADYISVRDLFIGQEGLLTGAQFWNLRSYDRINTPWGHIAGMEKRASALIRLVCMVLIRTQSGVSFPEAQVALAKVYVGADDVRMGKNEVVNIEKAHEATTHVDDIGKKDMVEKAVNLPQTVDEAREIIKRFEQAAMHDDRNV